MYIKNYKYEIIIKASNSLCKAHYWALIFNLLELFKNFIFIHKYNTTIIYMDGYLLLLYYSKIIFLLTKAL